MLGINNISGKIITHTCHLCYVRMTCNAPTPGHPSTTHKARNALGDFHLGPCDIRMAVHSQENCDSLIKSYLSACTVTWTCMHPVLLDPSNCSPPKPYKMAASPTEIGTQQLIMICPKSYHNNREAIGCVGAHPPHTLQYDYHCQYTHVHCNITCRRKTRRFALIWCGLTSFTATLLSKWNIRTQTTLSTRYSWSPHVYVNTHNYTSVMYTDSTVLENRVLTPSQLSNPLWSNGISVTQHKLRIVLHFKQEIWKRLVIVLIVIAEIVHIHKSLYTFQCRYLLPARIVFLILGPTFALRQSSRKGLSSGTGFSPNSSMQSSIATKLQISLN